MQNTNRPTGMFWFHNCLAGQIVSVLSTNMTGFGLTIWVFEKTGSATALRPDASFLHHAVFDHQSICGCHGGQTQS